MQVVFQMRYSYFGKSGWRSRASKDPGRLFSEERLKKRSYYFEKIALASLASQQDEDFKLVLLSSEGLPDWHKAYLGEMCKDVLGPDRAHVIFREPQRAGNCFRSYQHEALNSDDYTAQIVLDDDDAVSCDFVDVMRREALAMQSLFRSDEDYCYVSQAQGLSAVFEDGGCQLLHRTVPFNTQGLMLVARTLSRRNPFFTAHKKLARRHPARAIYGQTPYFIRAIHDLNDSRTMHSDDTVRPDEIDGLVKRFPLLETLLAEHALAA
ncbi:putative rhamnosyl transferase [Tateyamaria omphalii]|uniref:glycosyltransferase n=1 Tax=Tateyamaria omphalii TaxID=299262 RepID=UPI001C99F181|nr:glycosyltransferase [Tateyamaria omphalii]MBY5932174.1 putative rhamnosyl transferase [Tateyamaria omphalii]